MKIANILCPVDFSTTSREAIDHASTLARRHNADIHFVYVYEPVYVGGDTLGAPIQPAPPDIEPIRQQLQAVRPTGDGDITCHHELLFGFPGGALVGYAAAHNIDLIVMGTHGRSGVSRLLMGSVAEAVMRSATCPVLTVHGGVSPETE